MKTQLKSLTRRTIVILMFAALLGSSCAGDAKDAEHTESAVPAELRDSTEEIESHNEALKHLENIIDTTQGH